MDEVFLNELSSTLGSVDTESFGSSILKFIRLGGVIRNFGTFYVSEINSSKPVLSVWHGDISDYLYRAISKELLGNSVIKSEFLDTARGADTSPESIERFRPNKDDVRWGIYQKAGIIERLSITTRHGNAAERTFFLRSERDGPIREQELANLTRLLPTIHQIIRLRHLIVGSEAFHYSSDVSVTNLRLRGMPLFVQLSPREAEICDLIVRGMTITGSAIELDIAESSVRTLRRRAYRKLNISSATELSALILNERHMRS